MKRIRIKRSPRLSRAVGFAAAGTVIFALHGHAVADEGGARELAEPHFKAGVRLYKAGDFEHAHAEFLRAYEIFPHGSVLRNLGVCELQLGRPLDAIKHLRAAARASDLPSEQRALLEGDMKIAYADTGHLAVRATDGATIVVDGAEQGAAPLTQPIDVLVGKHAVEARLGGQSVTSDVEARAGEVVTADLPIRVPPAISPIAPAAEPPQAAERTPPREWTSPTAPPARASSWWTPAHSIGVGFGVAAVVGLGAGLSFRLASNASVDSGEAMRASVPPGACASANVSAACGDLKDKISTARSQGTLATASFIVSGAAALGAAGMFLFFGSDDPSPSPSARLHWRLGMAPGFASAVGEF